MPASILRVAATTSLALILVACTAEVDPSSVPTSTMSAATPIATPAPSVPTATPASPSPSATPQPTPEPTPVPVPPKPTEVTFDQETRPTTTAVWEVTQTVTWGAPRSEGVEIRVYGVTECIAEPADPAPGTNGPCLVVHTPLPASVRRLLATAPASDGAVSWTWTEEGGATPAHLNLPRRAGIPRGRAGCLRSVGPLDFCHRRAWRMVAGGSWRDSLLNLLRFIPCP